MKSQTTFLKADDERSVTRSVNSHCAGVSVAWQSCGEYMEHLQSIANQQGTTYADTQDLDAASQLGFLQGDYVWAAVTKESVTVSIPTVSPAVMEKAGYAYNSASDTWDRGEESVPASKTTTGTRVHLYLGEYTGTNAQRGAAIGATTADFMRWFGEKGLEDVARNVEAGGMYSGNHAARNLYVSRLRAAEAIGKTAKKAMLVVGVAVEINATVDDYQRRVDRGENRLEAAAKESVHHGFAFGTSLLLGAGGGLLCGPPCAFGGALLGSYAGDALGQWLGDKL